MAALADHEGLRLRMDIRWTHGGRFRLVEIGEFTDVVDLESVSSLAHLALPGEEPVNQLITPGSGQDTTWLATTDEWRVVRPTPPGGYSFQAGKETSRPL